MRWLEQGIELLAEVSTSGTFITPPFRVDYPFTGSGANPPDNWSKDFTTGQLNQYAVYNTSNGAFAFSSSPTNPHVTSAYAIARTFGVTPSHTYSITVDVSAFKDRIGSAPLLEVGLIRAGASTPYTYIGNMEFGNTGMPDQQWHQLSMNLPIPADVDRIKVLLEGRIGLSNQTSQTAPPWGVYFRRYAMVDVTTAAAPTFTWHSVECDSMGASIRYGRSRFTERYDVGTFNIELNNVTGDYTYRNPHPWGLRPGRMFRMRARYKGTLYPLCFGVIDRIATFMNPAGKATVTMTVFDTTSYTSDIPTPNIWFYNPAILNSASSLSGRRVNAILDHAGIAQSVRAIDTGIFPMQNVEESGRGMREEIGVTADSEGGSFFGERDGRMVYRDRSWSSRDPKGGTVQAQFLAYPGDMIIDPQPDDIPTDPNAPEICPTTMDTDWTLERVINAITLATVGGTRNYYSNAPSQQENGIRTYQRLDFVNGYWTTLTTDAQLNARAGDIFSTSLEALLRVKRLSYRPVDGQWEFTFTFFLDWLIRVFYYHPTNPWGFATVVRVQSIEHRITPTDWVVTLDVDQPISYTDSIAPLPPGGWDTNLWDINQWDEGPNDRVPNEGAYWNSGQVWNGIGNTWIGQGWSSGTAKWSDFYSDWKE